ncbi:tyrosine-type recombinase/integrase [Haloarcula marina]|uniref:tyrosine-type recombinase/integrase n=1 Tax=Haloarcula marina TaxID=2961574 RepID=UPI0020B84AF1|nr:tyrosine-type recombinase/integrase [Halomicroarcula marina]
MKNITRKKFNHELGYEFVVSRRNKSENQTLTGYRVASDGFLTFLDERETELEDVDWTDIDAWISSMVDEYAESSIKTRYNHLRTFIAWLQARKGYFRDRDVLPTDAKHLDITEYITRGKTRKEEEMNAKGGIVWVRDEEYELLKQNVPEPKFRNELILKMLRGMGLRRSEVAELQITPQMEHQDRYGAINLDDSKLMTPPVKSDSGREMWFGSGIARPLRRWIDTEREPVYYSDDSDYLFPSRSSEQLKPKSVTSMVVKAAERAGIQSTMYTDAGGGKRNRITPHALRHAYGVTHVRNGTDIMTLKNLMGHADISTTQTYLQFRDEKMREAQHRNAPDV